METLTLIVIYPFVFFIFWGPFAFWFATRATVRYFCMRKHAAGAVTPSFFILMAVFLPLSATSPGGNIPVIFPWWLAVVGLWAGKDVALSADSVFPAIVAVPLALWFISREARRQRGDDTKKSQ